MGRPRKPTAILKLEGDYAPSRHGFRGGEPQPEGSPCRPKGMPKDAAAFWDEYVPRLVKIGVATAIDAPALEGMCRWWARLQRHNNAELQDYRTETLAAMCEKQLKDYFSKFGMTPSDRAKLSVGESPSDLANQFLA